ncbi:MAG: nucleotidyl transferase AbiEii/AbiGii toxin family protein [bacterium]|nr:nucleotidyl transferase AbiEii/AbiGii toxin family protein [bacterium]
MATPTAARRLDVVGLSPLQRRIRRVVARLPEVGDLALAGGAALIVGGVAERPTNDLDFFAPATDPVAESLGVVEGALTAEGLEVRRLRSTTTYARLEVRSETETTYVDLANDFRLLPALPTPEGNVLSLGELAADKTLALASRAEARDYIDLHALARHFPLDDMCNLAATKDQGFRPAQLAAALAFFDERPRSGFDLDDTAYQSLRSFALTAADELRHKDRSDPYGLDSRAGSASRRGRSGQGLGF